jgi:uncharacterized protein involved in type VI secretion and phage assembly
MSHSESKPNGIVVGLVSDLNDPEKLGRVKVKLPHLDGQPDSEWARLSSLMGGPGRGAFFRPEVNDEVLVAFEHNDPRRPFILGGLWSQADSPPDGTGPPSENNVRLIRSRSGHVIKLDDTKGAEKIEIVDKDGSRKVVIDSAKQKITVSCDTGDVEVSAAAGSVTVKAMTISLKATGTLSIEATGTLSIKGATVSIN